MFLEALVIFVTLSLYWFFVALKPPPKYPPGPKLTLPFLGDALIVGESFAECYKRLQKTYGDCFSMYFGPYKTVVVNGYDLIQEVGASPDLAGRAHIYLMSELRGGSIVTGGIESSGGLVFGRGPSWSEQRRFTLHNLRNLGFGKLHMEDLILEEVTKLNSYLETFKSSAISAKQYINMAVVNSLWHIVAGSKLEYDDERLKNMIKFIDDIAREKGGPFTMTIFYYKFLSQLVLKLNMIKSVVAFENIRNFITTIINEHKKTYQEDNSRDFIDAYIKEMKEQKAQHNFSSSFVGRTGDINFLNVLMDLFMAGSETTSNTLNHAMLLLLQYPDVLKKMQAELDTVTGKSRLPLYADRLNTPYTEAVIAEIQRIANIAPVVNHSALRDTYIAGGKYFIPEGTRVSLNLGSISTNPKYFPDPKKFDPMRHLNKEGKFDPCPELIPFGIGRRRCLGETLARMSLFMFLTGLVSHFDFKKAKNEDIHGGGIIQGRLVDSIRPVTMRFVTRS